jgi:hypothetical protein
MAEWVVTIAEIEGRELSLCNGALRGWMLGDGVGDGPAVKELKYLGDLR